MARGRKKKIKKDAIPQEVVDAILALKPEDLSVEAAREQLAIDALKQQFKEDAQICDLKQQLKDFKEEIDRQQDVISAQNSLDTAVESHTTQDQIEAEENLKALSGSWQDDMKQRKTRLKFILKTLKKHMESGNLKTRI